MKKIKNFRIQIFLLLAVMLCLAFIPGQLQAGGTDESDKANNLFVYADDVNEKQVLLKVIPLSTLKTMMHGQDGTTDSTYYGSFIDAYKTPTYCEGKGVTIPELLDYTFAQASVANAEDLTYAGSDKLYFYSSDGPTFPVNYTYEKLLGVDRFYFSKLYNHWNAEDGEISNVAAVLDEVYRMEMPPYLAVESLGGRVFADAFGNNISSYVAANGGVVAGCLRDRLEDTESLRLVLPQTEKNIEDSEATYSNIRKWVYKVRLREDGTSPITSLGTVSDPTCTFTLSGNTLTITMDCADSDASIYYSTIDGHTKTPVNLYTGSITIEDYDDDKPFTLGVVAVREGYEDSAVIQANSANISDDPDDPSFVYALAADTEDIETGEAFTVAATLSADKDYTLYGAEYRMAIPTAAFSVGAVSSENGWEYGTATAGNDTMVTFTYLNIDGQPVEADTPLDIGSISLTPLQAGTATITVSEAIVTKEEGGLRYNSVTSGNLTIDVEAASSDTTIDLADFVGGIYTISEGGDYQLASDAAGTIEISTTDAVTINGNGMSGTANSGLSLDCTVSGVDLTIDDLYISVPVTNKNVIDFTGTGNILTLSGASLLENNSTSLYYAAIHVPYGGSLTIDGDGTLYVYKNSLGAAIGGDCDAATDLGETNGDITIAGGTIFAKGSMTGATIGAGQKGTGGKVYISGGVLNLMTKARGAVIGGGGEQGGAHGAGGDVYISGGTLLLYTDWTGSLIGCGNGNGVYTDGGKVYIDGGSLKTVITPNAGSKWATSTTENTVSDAAITAAKLNNDTDEDEVYSLVFDTADLTVSADHFTVKVDGEDFYAGAGHEWQVGNPGGTVNGGAFAADTTETNIYLYLTGEDHVLTVNGEAFQATWDGTTSTFSVEPASTGHDYWDGTADTSWYDAMNPLTAYTITTPEQLAGLASLVNAGNSFAGVTFTLANDITLNSESSTTNWTPIGTASVTVGSNREAVVGSGTPFAGIFDGAGYAVNGLYISSAANMQGLFGYLTGTVKDLTVNGQVISTAAAAGEYATLCVGAVTAFNHGGTIADVTNHVSVNAPGMYFVGGIAGCNLNGNITRSANLADVTGFQCVGGIAGRNGGTITYTYNAGKVDGLNTASKNGVGGIAGKNGNHYTAVETGIIDSCYNTGTVGRPGQKWVGGIAGFQNRLSSIKNCYASGTVVVGAGRYAAIVGQEEGTSANNYSLDTIASDTQETVIGTKLTDGELKTAASSLGGAFLNDTTGGSYPVLFWQKGLNLGTITVDSNIANGVVTAPAKATEGNTVTVTVTPSEGYRLIMDSLTYTVVGQDPVVITVTEGVYSFVMPAANVTINAAFEAASSDPHIWDGTADTSWYNSTDTVFHISTPEQLHGLADISNGIGQTSAGVVIPFDDFTGKTIYLDNDIWLNNHTSTGPDAKATKWEPIGWAYYIDQANGIGVTPFNGTLDGQGHTIYNMYQYQTETYGMPGSEPYKARGVSLIGYSAEACVAKNITATGYCYGNRYVSGIVGKVGTKSNMYNPAVGPGTTVENCVSYVTVTSTGSRGSGGVVGAAWNHPTVRNCVNYGSITGLGTDKQGTVGGVVGESEGLVENCVNYGTVTNITSNLKANAGGVVGNPQSGSCVTRNCYNLGAVSGGTAGGVIGFEQGTSYNCYNLGAVSSATGGVVGGAIGEIFGTSNYQTNLYYLETAAAAGVGKGGGTKTQVTSFAAGADIFNLVNGIGTDFAGRSFVANTTNVNGNNYPILRFQTTDTSTLESISIITPPTKVAYSATEVFNPAGMVVRADYSDGTSEMISGYTYPTEPLAAGTTFVTVSYQGKSTTQAITVNALVLDSIAITTVPAKTFYVTGETFDKTGMVVKATYNGTIVATLDPVAYTVSPDPLTTGTTAATISYEYQGVTKTVSQAITVMTALPELKDEYYQIEDVTDLLWFADQVSAQGNSTINAKLVHDLDLTDVNWAVPIGTSTRKFSGTLDGNGKSITGLIKAGPSSYYGIFGYGYNATVKDLAVNLSLTNAGQYTGGLMGYAEGCTIENITVNGSITETSGTYNGGITGYSAGSTFSGCENNADITVTGNYAAGIAGYTNGADVFTNCLNNGEITSSALYVGGIAGDVAGTASFTSCRNTEAVTGSYHVGGIAGRYASTGTISKCANSGAVTATSTSASANYTLGGIAGTVTAAGTIDKCYNTGAVTGSNSSIGGIAGSMTNASARMTNSYNTGSVTYTGSNASANIGGIVGYASNAAVTVQNCYNAGEVAADNTNSSFVAGVIGNAEGLTNVSNNYYLNITATQATGKTTSADANAVAKTAAEMSNPSFATALGQFYQAGDIYPILIWQEASTQYTITVDSNIANGVVTAPAQATEGNTVTVSVTPSEGYRLIMDSLTYTVVGQDPVVISVTESVYSFVMPAADVTVTAEFESIPVSYAWDGTTIDVSWYNTTDTTFEISTPAQLMGLAAIVNGIYNRTYNKVDTTVIGDDAHNKIVDGYGSNPPYKEESTATASWHFGRDDFEGKTVKLTADLDMGGVYNSADGTWSGPNYMPIGGQYLMDVNDSTTLLDASFNGTFDGQGHKVYNINCNRYTDKGYDYSQSIGGIVGRLGIHDEDAANGWNTLALHPTVKNVIVDGYVYGMRSVGGIVGKTGKTNGGAVIENCINLATVKSTDSKGLGGIAGAAWNGGVINNCANLGAITSEYGVGGGISGSCEARISNCYNVGYVQGGNSIGYNNRGASATNCYYLAGSASISGGMAGTEMPTADSMKTADFLALLNGDTRAWVLDSDNLLGGYPILRIMTADSSTLTGITKESDPTKLAYSAGETFNTGGLVIWANYSDSTREKLTDYTISKTGPLALGDTSITVSGTHDGQSYSYIFAITVTDNGIDSIAVTTQPTNLLYAQGECFDPAGMVVKATFISGTVTTLTSSDYTLNPDSLTPLTAGTTRITVSYTYDSQTVTADIPITVLNTAAPQAVDGVYQIASANDLLWFANRVNTGNLTINGKLTQDIDASSLTWKPIGSNKAKYAGHFDGNHQKITINLPGTAAYSGLFGYLDEGGEIKNLTVAGSVSGGNNTGGVTGYLNGATISGCTNMATVNGVQYVGGIAGNTEGAANILNCTNTGTITSVTGHTVGGIAGKGALTGSIENCSNSGTISATNNAGGIVGNAYGAATILKCFNSGSVTGTSTNTTPSAAVNSAGGIAGFVYAAATIDQCYNSGAIGGEVTNSGGIAGYLNDANSKVTNSYNVGSVTNSSTSANAAVGGIVGYLKNTGGFLQNCYNTGTLSLTASASNYLAGVIGYAGVITHVSNNYYLNTTATQATGLTVSTDANAQAKTSLGMRAASFVTALGNLYQLGPIYPALSWEKVVVTDEDVDINDGSPVEIGSAQDTTNIVLGNALVTAIGAANDVSLQLTTSNGEFTFDAGATDGIMAAAGGNDIVFRALQLTESDDPAIQDLIDDDALVFDFSLTTGGNPIFTEGSSSGMVSIRIPYELGSGDPDNIKVYLVNGGVKTPVSATYDNGYIIFSVEHFSIYSIEYQGLRIWDEFDGANTHFNGSDQVTVKIYARGDEAVTYGSYQADVDFNSAQLTFNSSASAMEDGTSYMNLSAPGKVQIGYSSSESISQNLSAGGTLLATLVFDVQPVATDGSTGSIGISNADFEAGGSAAQDANIGADLGYTLHNIRLTFQAGTGTTLTTTYTYVKYHEAGLYTDATYATSINVPVPVAASGYRLAADSESSPLWKDAVGTGYTSADIAAGTFMAGTTFTAQASRKAHSSGSGDNTSNNTEEEVEEDIEEDVQEDDSSPVKNFTDIKENDWYYAAVKFVVDRGLFTGISSTTFEPQTTMSRDMLVTVLYRLEGEPAVGNAASSLSDVNAGSWYANAVAWATANGIITGYDSGKFGPKDPVTREQLLAILYRYSSLKGYDISASSDLTGFTDSGEIKDYALFPFKWGTGNGLIDGKGAGILDPAGDATRAEVATILMRFIDIIQ